MMFNSSPYLFVLLLWILGLSILALILMGVDKAAAKLRRSRIRESTFGLLSFLGGFPGVLLGGIVFHHKTSKPSFWIPVFGALVLWGIFFLLLVR
jgi:uncharacterized membrane protein YsdA (DUF1294 family)